MKNKKLNYHPVTIRVSAYDYEAFEKIGEFDYLSPTAYLRKILLESIKNKEGIFFSDWVLNKVTHLKKGSCSDYKNITVSLEETAHKKLQKIAKKNVRNGKFATYVRCLIYKEIENNYEID